MFMDDILGLREIDLEEWNAYASRFFLNKDKLDLIANNVEDEEVKK